MTPMRMCAACRERREKSDLLRVVRVNGEEPKVDLSFKARGRGAYVCRTVECAALARKKRAFERAFKGAVDIKLYDDIEGIVKGK